MSDAATWTPGTLADAVSGAGDAVPLPAADAAVAVRAILHAAIGLISVQRRDVM